MTGADMITGMPGDEPGAKNFLIEAGILKVHSRCPNCGAVRVRHISRDRYRCRDCLQEWGIRKGSILEGLRISFRTFIALVRFFADDIPANDAANRLGIAYNTAYEVYQRVRSAMLASDSSGNALSMKESGPACANGSTETNGTPTRKKQVVFGIRLHDGRVTVTEVNDPDPGIITALPIPTMQRGNILFIDTYGKMYQGFITYVPDRRGQDIVRIRARNGLPWSPLGDFWNFAGLSWTSHRGLDRDRIPEFVQELAFRYNHRNEDIFLTILKNTAKSNAGP